MLWDKNEVLRHKKQASSNMIDNNNAKRSHMPACHVSPKMKSIDGEQTSTTTAATTSTRSTTATTATTTTRTTECHCDMCDLNRKRSTKT